MRIRSSFKTALDRQVGEAIAISREQKAGTDLMNSKAEYNRCKIQRLDTRTEKEKTKEIANENEIENKLKDIIKKMKCNKRKRSKESKMRTREMKDALIEIQNENVIKWKKRRKMLERTKKEDEIKEIESLERLKRKNIGENKKKNMIKSLRSKENKKEWFKEKTGHWRKYREKDENPLIDDVTDDSKSGNYVKGFDENVVENNVDKIVEIGRKVEFKMKVSILKRNFSDLKKSEYLRKFDKLAVCESSESLRESQLQSNCESLSHQDCLFRLKVDALPFTVKSSESEIPAMPPTQSMLVDSELDLLDIMSTWPEMFRTTDSNCDASKVIEIPKVVGNSKVVEKSLKVGIPMVNIDLNGQSLKSNLNQLTDVIDIDITKNLNDVANICDINVKLTKVVCLVHEYYLSSADLKRKLKNTPGNQRHLQEAFIVTNKNSDLGSIKPVKVNDRLKG